MGKEKFVSLFAVTRWGGGTAFALVMPETTGLGAFFSRLSQLILKLLCYKGFKNDLFVGLSWEDLVEILVPLKDKIDGLLRTLVVVSRTNLCLSKHLTRPFNL